VASTAFSCKQCFIYYVGFQELVRSSIGGHRAKRRKEEKTSSTKARELPEVSFLQYWKRDSA
jgi:hypothetical protein